MAKSMTLAIALTSWCLLAAAATAAWSVDVILLDGKLLSGELQSLGELELVIATPERHSETLELSAVLTITARQLPRQAAAATSGAVTLVDGSELPIDSFTSTDSTATLEVHWSEDSRQSLDQLPLSAIHRVQLQPLGVDAEDVDLRAQWNALLSRNTTSDVLVVRKPGTNTLTPVEGVLQSIGSQQVVFEVSGELVEVDRARVFGAIYYRGIPPAPADFVASGPGWAIASTSLSTAGDELRLRAAGDCELVIPTSLVERIDCSRGKVWYLSTLPDLRIIRDSSQTTIATVAESLQLRRDRDLRGGPLTIEFAAPGTNSSGLPRRVSYDRGLAVRAGTNLNVTTPRECSRFRCIAAIDPRSHRAASVMLEITVGDQRAVKRVVRRASEPIEIDLSVKPGTELVFRIAASDNAEAGAIIHFASARFLR